MHVTAFLMDEGLLSSISAGCGQLVKMLMNCMVYLITYTCFEIGRENGKEKNIKKKILVMPGAPGCWITRKRPPHLIYTLEQFTYIPFACTHQIKKMHDPWVCATLQDPWFAHQVKIARLLDLHIFARPSRSTLYNHYESLARTLGMHYDHYVSKYVRPSMVSK